MAIPPLDRCFFCDSSQIELPRIGICAGIAGWEYSFCRKCLEESSALEFWRRWVQIEFPNLQWPPKVDEERPRDRWLSVGYKNGDGSGVIMQPESTLVDVFGLRKRTTRRKLGRARKGIPNALRYQVILRDRGRCRLCGATADEAELVVDHLHPVSKGGKNDIENLRTLCKPCNSGKGAKLEEVAP